MSQKFIHPWISVAEFIRSDIKIREFVGKEDAYHIVKLIELNQRLANILIENGFMRCDGDDLTLTDKPLIPPAAYQIELFQKAENILTKKIEKLNQFMDRIDDHLDELNYERHNYNKDTMELQMVENIMRRHGYRPEWLKSQLDSSHESNNDSSYSDPDDETQEIDIFGLYENGDDDSNDNQVPKKAAGGS